MSQQPAYKLIRLRNGTHSVHSTGDAETFHPGIGPAAEAEALYVRQLQLPERVERSAEEFVIWDVGLGAAANALTAIRLIQESLPAAASTPKRLRIVSFDQTTEAAAFALEHSTELGYLSGYEAFVSDLIQNHSAGFESGSLKIEWVLEQGDFPAALLNSKFKNRNSKLAPHAVLFDPHSPKKNPAMWTVPLFTNLFRHLDPERPCALANFTRSTMARTAMLLGGFFVGVGHASGMKEETTVAANWMGLLKEPLDGRWLERAQRSGSAEPLQEAIYRQAPPSPE
ncbi:MAG TPA: MnmC family methyltransferase, partial [Candidatus Paceibacterota bacterium]|nr:MnmC family methyltransferase [Candidatus Paceibacterota bacterium]